MSSVSPAISSAGSFLKNVAFTYFPVTDWRRFYSPTIVFGTNIGDRDTEAKVLDSVGSYGLQLNRILDALALLIREDEAKQDGEPKKARSEEDEIILYRLLDLANKADEAAKRAKAS